MTPPQSMFKDAHQSHDGAPSPTTSNAKASSGWNSLYRSLFIASLSAVLCISTLSVYHGKHDNNDLKSSQRHLATRARNDHRELAGSPKLAWFLTFPGSGTNVVMHIIQKVSGRSTASNYSGFMQSADGSVHVSEEIPTSVFGEDGGPQYNTELPIPDKYVLTSSYGHGKCSWCTPKKYMGPNVLRDHFIANTSVTLTTEAGTEVQSRYSPKQVGKTLVMVRCPMETAVVRFESDTARLERGIRPSKNKFDGRCEVQDNHLKLILQEKAAYSKAGFWDEAAGVKCRAEFVKIFTFYNSVVQMLDMNNDLKDNVMFVRFDDFNAQNIKRTLKKVLSFLELPSENRIPRSVIKSEGKTMFQTYYTEKEKQAIAKLCKKMCLPSVWTLFEPYLGGLL